MRFIVNNVKPEDRETDVLHFLMTGQLLGGRSMEGVTWEFPNDEEMGILNRRRVRKLINSLD